jgi:hypothetical protein
VQENPQDRGGLPEGEDMRITRKSPLTGIEHTQEIPCTQEQIDAWKTGALIQRVMPQLTADQREFLMTGCTAEDWDDLFGELDRL